MEWVVLDENINNSDYQSNAFILKKEDFILFINYNEEDSQVSSGLYLSKKDTNGKWQ